MVYKCNIDEYGRVVSAVQPPSASPNGIVVEIPDDMPVEHMDDIKVVDGVAVFDPVQHEEEPTTEAAQVTLASVTNDLTEVQEALAEVYEMLLGGV